jgi:hypothetical protein
MNPFGLGQSAAAPNPYGYVPPNAYYGGTPQPQQQQYWPQNVPQSGGGGGPLGIYSQTPFCKFFGFFWEIIAKIFKLIYD